MRKFWLPFLAGIVVYGATILGSDHTGNQERQSEPVATGSLFEDAAPLENPLWLQPPVLTTTTSAPLVISPPEPEVVVASDDVWFALFGCETGYTYNIRAVSKSGTYRGAFQFDLETWMSVGEVGDPIDFSYEHQKAAAQRLHDRRGWAPWPYCSRKLGLHG